MFLLLYALSGLVGAGHLVVAGLWLRQFGSIFGATTQAAILALLVMGLSAVCGALFVGWWADQRRDERAGALLESLARVEWVLALYAVVLSLLLPYLGFLSGLVSFYSRSGNGWYSISLISSALRAIVALILLGPAALLMGGALGILASGVAQSDPRRNASRIALVFGCALVGAGLAFSASELWIVRLAGVRAAELTAVALMAMAGFAARWLSTRSWPVEAMTADSAPAAVVETGPAAVAAGPERHGRSARRKRERVDAVARVRAIPAPAANASALINAASAMCGASVAGLALIWTRHSTLLLGGFRSTSVLLFALIMCACGVGAMLGAALTRFTKRPAQWLVLTLGLLVVSTLFGLGLSNVRDVLAATAALAPSDPNQPVAPRLIAEYWLSIQPMLLECGIPSLFVGLALALANGVVQTTRDDAATRYGALLAWAAVGGAIGLLATAFVLLPLVGMQNAAMALALVIALAAIPADRATRGTAARPRVRTAMATLVVSLAVSATTLVLWGLLPAGDLLSRATVPETTDEQLLTFREGFDGFVAVTQSAQRGRTLVTDDRFLTVASALGHRTMRAVAHVPLALLDKPERMLIAGFGVGQTVHAATLHPALQRIEVVEPIRQVMVDASYFSDVNRSALSDRRVAAFVNDARQHLRMQSAGSYDVISVVPPSSVLDGATMLYGAEFYALARTRLKPGGYLAEWLPVYEVPPATLLAMIRAFTDVFPQGILIAANDQELVLLGSNAPNDTRMTVDPDRLTARLAAPPELAADLQAINLSTAGDIVTTFVAPAETLLAATRNSPAVRDDRPLLETGARSRLTGSSVAGVPRELLNLEALSTWCPRCYSGDAPLPVLQGWEAKRMLFQALATRGLPPESGPGSQSDPETRSLIQRDTSLREAIAQHTARHNARGIELASAGSLDEAILEFRNALRLDDASAETHWNLGRALVSRGQAREAVDELRRAVALDPKAYPAHYDLASTLLDLDQVDAAIDEFRAALIVMPNSTDAHNNLGIALGRKGRLSEAIGEFQQVLKINPEHGEARHNLDAALQAARAAAPGR